MRRVVIAATVVLMAGPASAQSAYVAATIGAEVLRTTTVNSAGTKFDNGSGEALAGSLRVGTFLAPRFGVELEFNRPGAIDADVSGPIYYAMSFLDSSAASPIADAVAADPSLLSIINQSTSVRVTSTNALVFGRQGVGSRVDLVYLGGIGFSRVVHQTEFGIPRGLLPAGRPALMPFSTKTTQYGVGPVVGMEARVGMTDHLRLVAGIRVHALGQSVLDGWLMRPHVGLGWQF